MGVTETLATFLSETGFNDLSARVVERGKELIIDFIGGALAGARTHVAEILTEYAKEKGGKREAGVIGKGIRITAANAAYLNGTFNHATELESVSQRTSPNPLAVIASSLALGEKMRLSGSRVFLELFVKVTKDWSKDPKSLKELGYK